MKFRYYNNKDQRINFPTPLHLATANDELRPAMQCVAFRKGYAYATDAHILIRQSYSLFTSMLENTELLDGKFLHRNAFARIYAEHKITIQEKGIQACDKAGNTFFYHYSNGPEPENFLGEDVVYPSAELIFDQCFADCEKSPLQYGAIGINANLLTRLNKVMYYEGTNGMMKFYLPSTTSKPILVEASLIERELQCAIIMPIMINNR